MKKSKNDEEASNGGYNFQDFQKRLSIMKQRYGLSNSAGPAEFNSTLNDLKSKVNNMLTKVPVPDDQNTLNDLKSRIQNLSRFK